LDIKDQQNDDSKINISKIEDKEKKDKSNDTIFEKKNKYIIWSFKTILSLLS